MYLSREFYRPRNLCVLKSAKAFGFGDGLAGLGLRLWRLRKRKTGRAALSTVTYDVSVILSSPFRINHFAGVCVPENTPCLAWGAKPLPRNDSPQFVNASAAPEVGNWPAFRVSWLSPFASAFSLADQAGVQETVTGGHFPPSVDRNQELVNGPPDSR